MLKNLAREVSGLVANVTKCVFLERKILYDDTHHIIEEINMQYVQPESIFSAVRKIFAGEMPAKQAVTEMRPLTEGELRVVAGGPEVEVGAGT